MDRVPIDKFREWIASNPRRGTIAVVIIANEPDLNSPANVFNEVSRQLTGDYGDPIEFHYYAAEATWEDDLARFELKIQGNEVIFERNYS